MPRYLKSMDSSKIPKLHLENKLMPHSSVKENQNIFQYTGSGEYRYISVARTSQPLIASTAAVYFQAKILHATSNSEIGIGLMHKDCDLNKHPGKNNRSLGFLSNGDFFVCKKKEKGFRPFKFGSIVGMGVKFASREIFITIDGKLIGAVKIDEDKFEPKYCPCISLRTKGDKVKLIFENFKFDFSQYLQEAELECSQSSIENEGIANENHYQMIIDYLQFYGYSKTLSKLRDQQKLQETHCYTQHPFIAKKVKIEEEGQIKAENEQIKDEIKMIHSELEVESDREKSTPARQRIMSEYLGEPVPTEIVRKRTYDLERELFESKRKNSVVWISDSQCLESPPKQKEKQKFIYNEATTHFLNNERITVIGYIREEKIEEANKLLMEKLPKIYQVFKFLKGYFQMHIYLKKLKEEGTSEAIKYVKQNNQSFKNYKREEFPIYFQNGKKQFRDFQFFMSLITQKNVQDNIALTHFQFQGFANHINQLILQSLGLYYESRLDLLINHIRAIGKKAQQYQIPGQFQINDV